MVEQGMPELVTRLTEADRDTARRAFLRFVEQFRDGQPVPEGEQIAFLRGMSAGVGLVTQRAAGDPMPPATAIAVSDLWDELNVLRFVKAGQHVNMTWAAKGGA